MMEMMMVGQARWAQALGALSECRVTLVLARMRVALCLLSR